MLQWNQEPFKSATTSQDKPSRAPVDAGSRSVQGFQKADALTLGFVMGVALATFSLVWMGDSEAPRSNSQAADPLPQARNLEAVDMPGRRSPGSLSDAPALKPHEPAMKKAGEKK